MTENRALRKSAGGDGGGDAGGDAGRCTGEGDASHARVCRCLAGFPDLVTVARAPYPRVIDAQARSPAYRYYTSLVGAWSGDFSFEITSDVALREWRFLDRMTLRFMSLLVRLFGPLRMSTTLRRGAHDDELVHTTLVTKLGVPLYATEETISLSDDGTTLQMKGTQRSVPPLGPRVAYESRGEVAGSADRATYFIPFFGAELTQRTQIVPEGLRLTQETSASRGHVVLARQAQAAE